MKRKITFIVTLLLLFAVGVFCVSCDAPEEEPPVPDSFSVKYSSVGNGYVSGRREQTVRMGGDAEEVIAVALPLYRFVMWSDTLDTNPYRKDMKVMSDINAVAVFEMYSYDVGYTATEGGYIKGVALQKADYGSDATEVVAVPYENYRFVKWSDTGSTDPVRTDKNVTEDITALAVFEEISHTFVYEYNSATSGNAEKEIRMGIMTFDEVMLSVPSRNGYIFDGWYSDYLLTERVSDCGGVLTVGEEILYSDSDKLYAKWKAENELTFPLLMVYVTDVKATLPSTKKGQEGKLIDIDYEMSDDERLVCSELTRQMKLYLDAMFKGFVTFEVDEYFTTEPVTADCFHEGWDSTFKRDCYDLFADDIPEVARMCYNYRSVMTTFSMNDFEMNFGVGAGLAKNRNACLHWDMFMTDYLTGRFDWLSLLDMSNPVKKEFWVFLVDVYMHEFVHTVESHYGWGKIYEYHKAETEHYKITQCRYALETAMLYLLHELELNGETVGMPAEFWKGEISLNLNYVAAKGGKVNGKDAVVQKGISFGGSGAPVTAEPDDGYRFVKWSDGITDATRTDTDVISFRSVKALFEEIQ